MAVQNALHTAFYADNDIYRYVVMPIGLINMKTSYHRMVNHLFSDMLGDKMEAYVEDMLVKSLLGVNYGSYLARDFERMNMHLRMRRSFSFFEKTPQNLTVPG